MFALTYVQKKIVCAISGSLSLGQKVDKAQRTQSFLMTYSSLPNSVFFSSHCGFQPSSRPRVYTKAGGRTRCSSHRLAACALCDPHADALTRTKRPSRQIATTRRLQPSLTVAKPNITHTRHEHGRGHTSQFRLDHTITRYSSSTLLLDWPGNSFVLQITGWISSKVYMFMCVCVFCN